MKIYKLTGDWAGMRGMKARGYLNGAADMASVASFASKLSTLDYGDNQIVISTNRPRIVEKFVSLFGCEVEILQKY